MAIRRPRSPRPALRHLSFLETMARTGEGDLVHRGAHASLLALRLLDLWILLGSDVANPATSTHREARERARALEGDAEQRAALLSLIDAIAALQEPDPQPVLPRVYALASLLEHRGLLDQAADTYATVARYVDSVAHLDLAYDAHVRRGFCLRNAGDFEWAEQAYATAGTLAARDRDRLRVLQARLGQAKVVMGRGNLAAADLAMRGLQAEAEKLDSATVSALVMHDRAAIARLRGDIPSAIRLAFDAFRRSPDPYDRERVLTDLASFLSVDGAYDAARDALRILEHGARHQGLRWTAKINLMELAGRTHHEVEFEQYRRALALEPLGAVQRAGYLRDVGAGCTTFGRYREARAALQEGLALATAHTLNQHVFEIEAALRDLEAAEHAPRIPSLSEPTVARVPRDISEELRKMDREAAGAIA